MLRLARIAVGIASNTASVVPIAAIATIESEHREEKEPELDPLWAPSAFARLQRGQSCFHRARVYVAHFALIFPTATPARSIIA